MEIVYSPKDYHLAEEFVATVLGMDEFYRTANQNDGEVSFTKEGLVPINLTNIQAFEITTWAEAIVKLDELYRAYTEIPLAFRRNYMLQQISSVQTLARWLSNEQAVSYRSLVRNLLYVNENPVPNNEQNNFHQRLASLLDKQDYKGNLNEAVERWQEGQSVEPSLLKNTLEDLLKEAKQLTLQLGFHQVEDIEVGVEIVTDVPYSAYCDFCNKKMLINGDFPYTYSDLKHLVAHEAFPGHMTHMAVREKRVISREIPVDAGLVITNTASSPIFEGIGDNGLFFIDWVKTIDDEIGYLLQIVKSVSALNGAHMVHVEGKSKSEVINYMRDFAFGGEEWANSRWRFITHPFRSPFIYGYWRGNEVVNHKFKTIEKKKLGDFYHYLYAHMHSNDSIDEF